MSRIWMFSLRYLFLLFLVFGLSAQANAERADLKDLRPKAEAGDAQAQFDLAHALQIKAIGDGISIKEVATDPRLVEARKWSELAAAAGNAEAANLLGGLLLYGHGGPVDQNRGLKLIRSAAAKGSTGALITLSSWYEAGNDLVLQDSSKSLLFMTKAAKGVGNNKPDHYAQWRLAMMILKGVGTQKDEERAYKWVVKASDGGNVNAMTSRGVMLATGEGVEEDDVAAREWYRKAAHSGDVNYHNGLRGLGYMMFIGEGGETDKVTGLGYLFAAKAAGNKDAKKLVDHFEPQIDKTLHANALEFAKKWIEENLEEAG